jgi:hypothetical protein
MLLFVVAVCRCIHRERNYFMTQLPPTPEPLPEKSPEELLDEALAKLPPQKSRFTLDGVLVIIGATVFGGFLTQILVLWALGDYYLWTAGVIGGACALGGVLLGGELSGAITYSFTVGAVAASVVAILPMFFFVPDLAAMLAIAFAAGSSIGKLVSALYDLLTP